VPAGIGNQALSMVVGSLNVLRSSVSVRGSAGSPLAGGSEGMAEAGGSVGLGADGVADGLAPGPAGLEPVDDGRGVTLAPQAATTRNAAPVTTARLRTV
jgi:hypothetical protein